MRKTLLLLVCSLFISAPAFANWLVICPTDTNEIETQIDNNWGHSGASWYASWAQVQMGNVTGTGGVRGPLNNGMPTPNDRKPHLQFMSVILSDDTDRGEVEFDCQYLIVHDPEVYDRNFPSLGSIDNVFWMKGFIIGTKNQCRQISRTTVTCY